MRYLLSAAKRKTKNTDSVAAHITAGRYARKMLLLPFSCVRLLLIILSILHGNKTVAFSPHGFDKLVAGEGFFYFPAHAGEVALNDLCIHRSVLPPQGPVQLFHRPYILGTGGGRESRENSLWVRARSVPAIKARWR